jgi:hypothetical protein
MNNEYKNWLDTAGDHLEADGFRPGCIFEFHDELDHRLCAGGVVATNLSPNCGKVTYLA